MWFLLSTASAATLAQWIPTGFVNSHPTPLSASQIPASVEHPQINAAALFSRTPDYWDNTNRLPHGETHTGPNRNPSEYVQFGLDSAVAVVLEEVRYAKHSYEGDGARKASIRWSLDSYATNLDVIDLNQSDDEALVFDLTGTAPLVAPDVRFRVYFYDAQGNDFADLDGTTGLELIGEAGPLEYADADGDGFGDASSPGIGPGFVSNDTDCDDGAAGVNPAASEVAGDGTDQDCDGVDDCFADGDGDGFGAGAASPGNTLDCSATGESDSSDDCDDADASTNPGATEQCDALDHDCDGAIHNGLPQLDYYVDGDGDGFGGLVAGQACAPPAGFVGLGGDCDDTSSVIRPDATDACDGVDDDCDGVVDDDAPLVDWYTDGDGDGYGGMLAQTSCAAPPGTVAAGGDCDDTRSAVSPDAQEVCDTADNDCDGAIDDQDPSVDAPLWFIDSDGDGYGDIFDPGLAACIPPTDHVADSEDCDDIDPDINPIAPEACPDGFDNDCDGLIDANDPDYVEFPEDYWLDGDGDGFGTSVDAVAACSGQQPPGYVPSAAGDDCNDADDRVYPGAEEVCDDGADNDCDGVELSSEPFWPDADGDGYGDAGSPPEASCEGAPTGQVDNALDCDDGDASVNPDATEVCNGVDDDCDPATEEVVPTWWADGDEDGLGDPDDALESCDAPAGFVDNAEDCAPDDGMLGETCTTKPPVTGCQCDGSGGVPAGVLLLLLPALARRRKASAGLRVG